MGFTSATSTTMPVFEWLRRAVRSRFEQSVTTTDRRAQEDKAETSWDAADQAGYVRTVTDPREIFLA